MPEDDLQRLKETSIKIRNFKCFGEEEQGFEGIELINLIIGKNNSGKSSLLDMLSFLIETPKSQNGFSKHLQHKNKQPAFVLSGLITEEQWGKAFSRLKHREGKAAWNPDDYGSALKEVRVKWTLNSSFHPRDADFADMDDLPERLKHPIEELSEDTRRNIRTSLTDSAYVPFPNKTFKRISSERDISPEKNTHDLKLDPNGSGATNLIQNYTNNRDLLSALMEKTLLEELNNILQSDAFIARLVCQKFSDDRDGEQWEIFLEEENKGLIALSESGSGLKTIILVLLHLHVLPHLEQNSLSNYVFAFEELENNLHPALHRRLLDYLYQTAKNEDCIFFLTTHSSVEIDFFSKNKYTQIVHVTHEDGESFCKTVEAYADSRNVLNDLDVRASDLLQSNCVIWVEGPSDRIYLNCWIKLWSDGELREGLHYQCVFYGGRLLAHLDAKDPKSESSGVATLRVNRNAILVIDSDKRFHQMPLNDTKKRMIDEIKEMNGFAWVTKGKEIENYIDGEVLEKGLSLSEELKFEQYDSVFDTLAESKTGKHKSWKTRKPLLAEKLAPHFTKEILARTLDLGERLESVCQRIRAWNGLPASPTNGKTDVA